jgi:hypothetical protein
MKRNNETKLVKFNIGDIVKVLKGECMWIYK